MKKASGLILLLVLSGATLWATDYSVILQKATENSPEMRNAELTYQNSLLTQQQNDLDDSVKVTVSTGETGISIPFQSTHEVENILGGVRQSNTELSLTPTVEVVLPNDGQTTIKATSGLGFQYADGSYYRVEPGISASHTFDLTGFDSDLATSISNARSSLLSEQTWQNARLSFENSVLTSIRAIVQAEQQLAEAQYNLSKAEKTLSDAIQLGNVTEGSVSYQQSVNNINLQKNNIAAYEEQIAVAGQQYTTLTGLVWDGVENLPSPDLSFQILDGGNTNVVLAQMDVQIAEQAIATKNHELNPSGIRLSGGVSGTLSSEDNNASGNVGLLYSAGNWSVGGSFSGSYDRATFTPSMTISGSWTNKTTKRSDDLALQKLNNDLISAQNDLIQARTSYIQNAQALQIDIMNHNFTLQQAVANRNYLANNLAYVQSLYDEGLATEQQLSDAQRELEWADVTDKVNTIDGLILQNRIAMLNI